MQNTVKTIHPVDIAIGLAIRGRRILLGITQTELGAAIGVTFQQIQKYERGSNRVSGSAMHGIAAALACHPGDFFPAVAVRTNDNDIAAALEAHERSADPALQAVA